MLGRASGLGARMSSMVLFILPAHRSNHRLNKRLFVSTDSGFLIKVSIGSSPVPSLCGNPAVHAAEDVLGGLAKRDKEPRESRSQICLHILCLGFILQRTPDEA